MKILISVDVMRKKLDYAWVKCHLCEKDIENIGEVYYESDFSSESNLLPEQTIICKECSQEDKNA